MTSRLCVVQALYAYFTGCPLEEALQRPWPRHAVLELTPARNSHLFLETSINLDLATPVLDALPQSRCHNTTPSAPSGPPPLPPS